MRFVLSLGRVAIAYVAVAGCQQPSPAPGGLEGAWQVTETRTSASASTGIPAQPGLYLFLDRHYSMMYVPGPDARARFVGAQPTDAEKIRAYDSFVANTGTYELLDSLLITRPMVARSPNFMAGGGDTLVYQINGDTLWLVSRQRAENDPAPRRKLLRVE
jgi:hypothetical protein